MSDRVAEAAFDHVDLTVGIVAAYVSHNSIAPSELSGLILSVHTALTGLLASGADPVDSENANEKATTSQIRKSITPDALISFIDGKPYKTLKRHLSTRGFDADSYRTRYGLPADYPMVATTYSATRSAVAKSLGLGRKPTV